MDSGWKKWRRRDDSGAVFHQSIHQNVYHCTVQKSASQWIRRLLSDQRTYKFSGLGSFQYQQQLLGNYDPRKLTERRFTQAFPHATIATPIYIDYEGFASIPKPARYKAFFVMRDPRDVVVSWYFPANCRTGAGDIERIRQDLLRLSESDGLLYTIDHLADFGLFQAQRSWADAPIKDNNVLWLRYEDLIGADQFAHMERLMQHCDIRLPTGELVLLLNAHSFEELSGRERGDEDVQAHYRKGIAGDWRNHFNDAACRRFDDIAGDLIETWNYT